MADLCIAPFSGRGPILAFLARVGGDAASATLVRSTLPVVYAVVVPDLPLTSLKVGSSQSTRSTEHPRLWWLLQFEGRAPPPKKWKPEGRQRGRFPNYFLVACTAHGPGLSVTPTIAPVTSRSMCRRSSRGPAISNSSVATGVSRTGFAYGQIAAGCGVPGQFDFECSSLAPHFRDGVCGKGVAGNYAVEFFWSENNVRARSLRRQLREAREKSIPSGLRGQYPEMIHVFIADGRTHGLSGGNREQGVSVVALGHRLVAARHGIVYLHAEALQRPDRQRLVGEDYRERCVAGEPLRVDLLAP